jgi:hypothetical protein
MVDLPRHHTSHIVDLNRRPLKIFSIPYMTKMKDDEDDDENEEIIDDVDEEEDDVDVNQRKSKDSIIDLFCHYV